MSRLPDVGDKLTVSGVLTNSSRLFLRVLQDIIDSNIVLFYRFKRFDSLSLIQDEIKTPQDGMTVIRTGEGLAIYKASISAWVLAADDTTPIT